MLEEILFFDKDETLVSHGEPLPGMREFLEGQSKKRDCVVVTTGGAKGKVDLESYQPHIIGYYGGDVLIEEYYERPDGTLARIKADYHINPVFLAAQDKANAPFERRLQALRDSHTLDTKEIKNVEQERERAIKGVSRFFNRIIHKQTGHPFDPKAKYHNPHSAFLKDLLLAKRLYTPKDYATVRSVMIGNRSDIDTVMSDPSVPLIEVFANKEKVPNWAQRGRVEYLLSELFGGETPSQVFDQLFSQGTDNTLETMNNRSGSILEKVIGRVGDTRFRLKRRLHGEKIQARVIEEYDVE